MNKKTIGIITAAVVILTLSLLFLLPEDEQKFKVQPQEKISQPPQEKAIEEQSVIRTTETKSLDSHKVTQEEDLRTVDDISDTRKIIYSVLTRDHKYELKFVSDIKISSKPVKRKFDSGVVINENFIIYGKVNGQSPYRMLFGKGILDNINNIMFILKDNTSQEEFEAMPFFLYSIEKTGKYAMEIVSSPLQFSNPVYNEKKYDFQAILEKIQVNQGKAMDKQLGFSKSSDHLEPVK